MSTTNHPVMTEEIELRSDQFANGMMGLGTYNEKWPYADKLLYNNLKKSHKLGAEWGFSLSQSVIEDQAKEIERLKELLREICVRANIIFPERENEIEMFDERFKGQHDLFINLNATLGLGEMDEESKIQNEKALKAIKRTHNL